jgi:hypothetical protein
LSYKEVISPAPRELIECGSRFCREEKGDRPDRKIWEFESFKLSTRCAENFEDILVMFFVLILSIKGTLQIADTDVF